jgi:phosphatidylglycerol:prolipoprotein diacylglycerol transferase
MLPELKILGLFLPTYFLVLSLVFSLIVFVLVNRAKKNNLKVSTALDLYLCVFFGSLIGARLFYVFYQEPSHYLSNPLEILYFWNGGLVFFGGFISGTSSILAFCFFKKESLTLWLNFCAPLLALGYGLGRIACFLNGCCYGEVTGVWWAVFMHEALRHPTQIYATLMELLLFFLLLLYERKKGFNFLKPPVFSLWLVGHGIGRLVMEHYRADNRGELIFDLMSVSSFISLLLILLGICCAVWISKKQNT